MTKKSAITKLTLIIVFTIIGAFLSLICFNIPFSNSRWNSFVGGLNLGNDVSNGVVANYEFSLMDSSKTVEDCSKSARNKIYGTLNKYYSEPSVSLVGENKLTIEIGSLNDNSDENRVELALNQIGGESNFSVSDEDETQIISLNMVKSLTYEKITGTHTLVIQFNKTGTKILQELSEKCYNENSNLIVHFSEDNEINSVPSSAITDGKLYISGGINKASSVATIINMQCEESGVVLAFKNSNTTTGNLGFNFSLALFIIILIIAVFVVILVGLKHKMFAISLLINLILFISIFSLLLNIIPGVQITAGTCVGMVLALMIMMFSSINLFNKTKNENLSGKKMKTAFDFAFKKTLKNLLDLTFVILIPAFVLIFVGSSSINNFALALCIGLSVNLFITLVVERETSKSLIKIFNKKPELFNLKKEVLKNENL